MSILEQAATAWWNWMWPMFWQVNLLIVIVWLLDQGLRRWAWPQVRYALWLLVLLKLVIPPSWSLPTGVVPGVVESVASRTAPDGWARSLVHAGLMRGAETGAVATDEEAGGPAAAAGTETAGPRAASAAAGARAPDWRVYPFLAWLLGMGVFAGLLLARLARLRRWHDEQEPRPAIPPWYHEILVEITRDWKLGRLPAIVFSDRVATPAVCGIWRPVLFLPRDYLGTLSREEARHVLLHELAHLKRGDLRLHAATLLLQVVYWFNPLLALARRQIQHVREICCDLTVAGVLQESTVRYRATLLATARQLLSESVAPGLGLLGVFEEPFRLVPRLRWLERPTWRWRGRAAAAAVALAAFMIPFVLPMAVGSAPTGGVVIGLPDALDAAPSGAEAGAEAGADTGAAEDLAADSSRPGGETGPAGGGRVLYQRNATTVERCLLGFCLDRRRVAVSETWFGRGVVAASEPGRTLIVDRAAGRMTYIDHVDEVYVRADLPLDLESILSDDLARRQRHRRSTGEVEETGRTVSIGGLRCREYAVHMWRDENGAISDENRFTVCAAADAPCDMEAFDAYVEVLRQLYDRDDECRRELRKIKGPQLRLEGKRGGPVLYERVVDELEVLEERTPPRDVFEVPAGYREVSRLTELR